VLEQHGQLDIMVNNAGITIDKTVRKMSVEDWDRVIHVNLSGAFYLSRAVLQHMLDRGYGRIINISSVIGEKGNIGQANYSAAGSGLFGLTTAWPWRRRARGSRSTRSRLGSSPPRWSRPCPRRSSTR
jgi:acetoacetyl-CoA reductase